MSASKAAKSPALATAMICDRSSGPSMGPTVATSARVLILPTIENWRRRENVQTNLRPPRKDDPGMWQQNYTPLGGSLPLSALVAALPIFVLLLLLGVIRKPAWVASLAGLGAAALVAAGAYGMPWGKLGAAMAYGAAFGLFPIGWVVFAAILLYRVTVESGKFEVLKDSIGNLTGDRRLQALLIAFAFGAFIEGAAGFGTPVAVAAAMLTGLGFAPFEAAAICLLANTAPVDRHSDYHVGAHHGPAGGTPERPGGPHLRAGLAHRSRLSGGGDVGVEGAARRSSGGRRVRGGVRPGPVRGLEFRRRAAYGYSGVHGCDDRLGRSHSCNAGAGWAETAGPQSGRRRAGLGPLCAARGSRSALGLQATTSKRREPHVPLAAAAQCHPTDAARGREARGVPGRLHVQLALRLGDRVFPRGVSGRGGRRSEAPAVRERAGPDRQAVGAGGTHAGGRARPGVSDELLRRYRDPWAGLRRHRPPVSVLQRAARLAGRFPHRQRHLFKRLVRVAASSDRGQAGDEPRADGRRQFRRRRHGQNDQPHQHRGSRRGHVHEARRGGSFVPLHAQAQHHSGFADWVDCGVLRLRSSVLGDVVCPIAVSYPPSAISFRRLRFRGASPTGRL